MLDNILNTVRQGVEQVQRKGEELTQVARLKVEVFQLSRELDGHFARLGRAVYNGAESDLLRGIRDDIGRTEADIRSREQLITELGDDSATHQDNHAAAEAPQTTQVQTNSTVIDLQKPAAPASSPSSAPVSEVSPVLPANSPAFIDESKI